MQQPCFLVAGGSSGLGAACVRRLVAAGWRGVVADLKPPQEALLTAITPLTPCGRGAGGEGQPQSKHEAVFGVSVSETEQSFIFCPADVTDEAAVRAALTTAREHFGPVRGVVVCAGVAHAERIAGREGPADLSAFRRVVEVNLIGTFNVLRLAADSMQSNDPDVEGQRGVIILTASIAAFEAQTGQAAYSASKGGVVALTLTAARELGPLGIRVVSIAPGVFETPLMTHVPDECRQSLAAQTPFPPRFGRPEEFAAFVEHILANAMLNGEVIRLDGGLRMAAR